MKQLKVRRVWGFNPVTRVIKSKKVYNRKRDKQNLRRDININENSI